MVENLVSVFCSLKEALDNLSRIKQNHIAIGYNLLEMRNIKTVSALRIMPRTAINFIIWELQTVIDNCSADKDEKENINIDALLGLIISEKRKFPRINAVWELVQMRDLE
jgi:hypothetical protein